MDLLISLVSACTALFTTIVGPFTLAVARRQFNATVLSANRQRWIETLRDMVAELISLLLAAMVVRSKWKSQSDKGRGALGEDPELLAKLERNAVGKAQIRKAFEAIASHFKHAVNVKQAGMKILESEDTALVLAKTIVTPPQGQPIKRDATYVFRRTHNGDWLCAIDNSYGHELFLHENMVNDGARAK